MPRMGSRRHCRRMRSTRGASLPSGLIRTIWLAEASCAHNEHHVLVSMLGGRMDIGPSCFLGQVFAAIISSMPGRQRPRIHRAASPSLLPRLDDPREPHREPVPDLHRPLHRPLVPLGIPHVVERKHRPPVRPQEPPPVLCMRRDLLLPMRRVGPHELVPQVRHRLPRHHRDVFEHPRAGEPRAEVGQLPAVLFEGLPERRRVRAVQLPRDRDQPAPAAVERGLRRGVRGVVVRPVVRRVRFGEAGCGLHRVRAHREQIRSDECPSRYARCLDALCDAHGGAPAVRALLVDVAPCAAGEDEEEAALAVERPALGEQRGKGAEAGGHAGVELAVDFGADGAEVEAGGVRCVRCCRAVAVADRRRRSLRSLCVGRCVHNAVRRRIAVLRCATVLTRTLLCSVRVPFPQHPPHELVDVAFFLLPPPFQVIPDQAQSALCRRQILLTVRDAVLVVILGRRQPLLLGHPRHLFHDRRTPRRRRLHGPESQRIPSYKELRARKQLQPAALALVLGEQEGAARAGLGRGVDLGDRHGAVAGAPAALAGKVDGPLSGAAVAAGQAAVVVGVVVRHAEVEGVLVRQLRAHAHGVARDQVLRRVVGCRIRAAVGARKIQHPAHHALRLERVAEDDLGVHDHAVARVDPRGQPRRRVAGVCGTASGLAPRHDECGRRLAARREAPVEAVDQRVQHGCAARGLGVRRRDNREEEAAGEGGRAGAGRGWRGSRGGARRGQPGDAAPRREGEQQRECQRGEQHPQSSHPPAPTPLAGRRGDSPSLAVPPCPLHPGPRPIPQTPNTHSSPSPRHGRAAVRIRRIRLAPVRLRRGAPRRAPRRRQHSASSVQPSGSSEAKGRKQVGMPASSSRSISARMARRSV
ncbi:hypothetical protein DFJ74DRAFT_420882 [Hyaloraphidium curvatum]|nr:hypothetical protein DFJ74DRAFT_420882 [Hyaloraphidium curvatum]